MSKARKKMRKDYFQRLKDLEELHVAMISWIFINYEREYRNKC